jgi:hypothetical protein
MINNNILNNKLKEIIDINDKFDKLKNINYSNNIKAEFIFNNIEINIDNINFKLQHHVANECPVCYNNKIMNNKFFTCNHLICTSCYKTWNNKCTNEKYITTCPLCRKY